jgi:hypothetical protein
VSDDHYLGEDRRTIPVHILQHIDSRLTTSISQILTEFKEHTGEEMDRYKDILDQIEANRQASDKRHTELTNIIHDHTHATEEMLKTILSGFPKNAEGKADLSGHAEDHQFRIEEAKDAKEFRKYIKRTLAGAILLAVIFWAGPTLLKAVVAYAS